MQPPRVWARARYGSLPFALATLRPVTPMATTTGLDQQPPSSLLSPAARSPPPQAELTAGPQEPAGHSSALAAWPSPADLVTQIRAALELAGPLLVTPRVGVWVVGGGEERLQVLAERGCQSTFKRP